MPALFESITINNMPLGNRIVRSATWEGMCAADGRPTRKLANCLYRPGPGRRWADHIGLCLCQS